MLHYQKEELPMQYEVPNLVLIPQDKSMACWFASARMLIEWRRNTLQMSEINLLDPTQVPQYMHMYLSNDGIPWALIRQFARDLGLVSLPLMSPTSETILHWLYNYGPIWVDGSNVSGDGHVVVVGGIAMNPNRILILDPAPLNVGKRRWHPMSHLASILRDGANPDRNQFMLRLP